MRGFDVFEEGDTALSFLLPFPHVQEQAFKDISASDSWCFPMTRALDNPNGHDDADAR